MALERVEVAEARWPEDRRTEPEVGGVEDRVVVAGVVVAGVVVARIVARVDPRDKALDQLDERLDPETAGEMVVEVRDRLAMDDVIVRQVSIGGDGSPSSDLQVDPMAGLGRVTVARPKSRRESPRRAGRRVHVAHMRQLHRRMGGVGGMVRV
jgi:hypothetical protein